MLALLTGGIIHASDTLRTEKKISLYNISWNGIISGDQFGMQYVPSAAIRFGKRMVFSAGPMFSPISWKSDGYIISSQILLLRENDSYNGHMNISSVISYEHFNEMKLSAACVKNEIRTVSFQKAEAIPNFSALQFSGWEVAGGFAVSYRLRCGLLFNTEAGFSYYESHQQSFPEIITVRENQGISLQLRAGIGWAFGKLESKSYHQEKMIAQDLADQLLLSDN